MDKSSIPQEKEWSWLALPLAFTSASIDVVGYVTLLQVFTGNMSGNTILLGGNVAQQQWAEAIHRGVPIPLFFCGAILGAVVNEFTARRNVRRSLGVALGLEALLVLGFILYGDAMLRQGELVNPAGWRFDIGVGFLAVALGVQAATIHRVAGRTVRTVFISGMLTNLAVESTHYVLWLRDHAPWRSLRRARRLLQVTPRQECAKRVALYGGIWCCYVSGALAGAVMQQRWALHALVAPLILLAVMVAADVVRPFRGAGQSYRRPF